MDFKSLGYLTAIVETGSMSKAADQFGLSQPALSKAVGLLEAECGLTLLSRGRRGIAATPTIAGQVVLGRARAMLTERRHLLSELEALKLENEHLRVLPKPSASPSKYGSLSIRD